jgi:hypothetical protein
MKRTIKFWTKEEDKMISVVFKKTESQSETARILRNRMDRSFSSIQARASKLFGNNKLSAKNKSVENKGVTLPTGFTFDIKPNRVVMFTDHVRLYF